MKYSRYQNNMGRPEDIFKSGSNQVGGTRFISDLTNVVPMGPKGGIHGIQSQSTCGINNQSNMNASIQHTALQQGGNKVIPQMNAGFETDLAEDIRGSYPIIKGYSSRGGRRKPQRKSKKQVSKRRQYSKTKSKSKSKSKRLRNKKRSSTKSLKKNHKKNHKKKYTKRNRLMKGGYHQYGSNTPSNLGYEVVSGETFALNNPVSFKSYNNVVDNYNHMSGKGFETGVFDEDVL